jgi:Uma2 family endonuclease
MLKIRIPERQRLILDNVSWNEYTRLLRSFEDRHLRLTYDRGRLEIMTLSHEHKSSTGILARLVITLTEELNMEIRDGRSTTLRRKKKLNGLESDNCFWIAHAVQVRGKKVIDLRTDPPPDLSLEIDVSRSSMNRMRIYASINVPEVWHHDKTGLSFWRLNADGKYDSVPTSPTFPLAITPADLLPFIAMREQMDDNAVIRQFRAWIRAKLTSQP